MYGWTFAARTLEELSRLIRAMGKHRYLAETDLRLHYCIDKALAAVDPEHRLAAERFKSTLNLAGDIELTSRDLRLWRPASPDEVVAVLERLWGSDETSRSARRGLEQVLRQAQFVEANASPFAGDPEEPPHPELILLDWVMLPVDELDSERHQGALRAMEDSGDEVDPSSPVYVEGPTLAEAELCRGSFNSVLSCEPTFWADGPYSYVDYVFRGVSKAAGLVDPPIGYRDGDR